MTPIRKRMLEAGVKLGMTAVEMDRMVWGWLSKLGDYFPCPWDSPAYDYERCDICDAMFPSLGAECPCTQFGLPYVRRRAREALEE